MISLDLGCIQIHTKRHGMKAEDPSSSSSFSGSSGRTNHSRRWLKATSNLGLITLILPLLAPACEGQNYLYEDQQYLWLRAYTMQDEPFTLSRGTIMDAVVIDGKQYFLIASWCDDYPNWPNTDPCLTGRLETILMEGVRYDVVGWSEPSDRSFPEREVTVFRSQWTCCKD